MLTLSRCFGVGSFVHALRSLDDISTCIATRKKGTTLYNMTSSALQNDGHLRCSVSLTVSIYGSLVKLVLDALYTSLTSI